MTYIIALTGGIGSGKSTITDIFSSYGVTIVDTDIISRQIIEKDVSILIKIVQYFGNEILLKNGTLNRMMLRKKIFNQPNGTLWLNNLLHPLILKESKNQLKKSITPYTLWVVPMLIENNLQKYANRILIINVNINNQINRTIKRDNISDIEVKNILLKQTTYTQRLIIADDIVDNNGDISNLKILTNKLHNFYLKLAISSIKNK
ncbi:Dephospho-CoA kinase [Serratia symbiotica]|nr:Dephospho-CoA kinase [Serratia symbiotica]